MTLLCQSPRLTRRGYSGGMMKAHVFVISMLTGIVVTYAVLLLGCLFIDKTLPTVDVGKRRLSTVWQILKFLRE
ncbi:hypothetical protein KDI57_00035 [Escherichia coli]|nr:hypothetical protein [Escherichia coli]